MVPVCSISSFSINSWLRHGLFRLSYSNFNSNIHYVHTTLFVHHQYHSYSILKQYYDRVNTKNYSEHVHYHSEHVHYYSEHVHYYSDDVHYYSEHVRYCSEGVHYYSEGVRYCGEDVRYCGEDVHYCSEHVRYDSEHVHYHYEHKFYHPVLCYFSDS